MSPQLQKLAIQTPSGDLLGAIRYAAVRTPITLPLTAAIDERSPPGSLLLLGHFRSWRAGPDAWSAQGDWPSPHTRHPHAPASHRHSGPCYKESQPIVVWA